MRRTLLLLALVTCVIARWSPWKEVNGECSDTCGMCGSRVIAERTCISKECHGLSQRNETCGEALCLFPRRTCCHGYMKGLEGTRFKCIPH